MNLMNNIDKRLSENVILEQLDKKFKQAISESVFHSPRELENYINSSSYILYRGNEYHIIERSKNAIKVMNAKTLKEGYIKKNKLLENWQKVMIPEEEGGDPKEGGVPGEKNEYSQPEQPGEPFQSKIQTDTVDRFPLLNAIEEAGYTVTELADKVGVDPPAISRLLRVPKSGGATDPGGRNPSVELASKICKVLRIDPVSAFPDIFGNMKQYNK